MAVVGCPAKTTVGKLLVATYDVIFKAQRLDVSILKPIPLRVLLSWLPKRESVDLTTKECSGWGKLLAVLK